MTPRQVAHTGSDPPPEYGTSQRLERRARQTGWQACRVYSAPPDEAPYRAFGQLTIKQGSLHSLTCCQHVLMARSGHSRRPAFRSPSAPDIPDDLEEFQPGALEDRDGVEDASIVGGDYTSASLPDKKVVSSRLIRPKMAGANVSESSFVDCEITDADLANVRARGLSLLRVKVVTSRLVGIDLAEADLTDVSFVECRMNMATLRFSKLQRVAFDNCELVDSDFIEADLSSVMFSSSNLSGAEMSQSRHDMTRFKDCDLNRLRGVASLRGAEMIWSDMLQLAPAFARAVGVELFEP